MPVDAAPLAALIERQATSLRMWVGARCSSADDIVQEAFCRLAILEPPPDNPVAWLYRVCRNLANNQRLADARRRGREQASARKEAAPDRTSDSLEVAEAVAAVEDLVPELREVLVARVWGQLSLAEVAELCGISTTTAFRRYEEALRTLRNKLESPANKRT
jgi:RNA polymerase sigma-70 factor (ECF subfamily)